MESAALTTPVHYIDYNDLIRNHIEPANNSTGWSCVKTKNAVKVEAIHNERGTFLYHRFYMLGREFRCEDNF